ncbi:MAG: hypothetical protein C5B51_06110 [Terriglobia bacterium]|nr:MAG: hypothetical protein C5B51_06110 [Terriglobia bacterium]
MWKLRVEWKCILLLSFATALWGQAAGGGTLSGKITSANGAAVPNAEITITNVTANTSQKALTGPDGSFSVAGLAPGTYRVDVVTAGFKRTSQQNIELTTTGPTTVNLSLEAGSPAESVEIKGTSPVTQTDNGEVGVGLGTRTIRELPVIDRNHQELTSLQSGITPPVPALDQARDPDRNRFYSTNGQAPWENNNYFEGVVNREPFRGTAVRVVPMEALEQKNISTANLTMDKGVTGGAFVTDSMRAGTNGWHGGLFEFYSGNPLRTRSFFAPADISTPHFVYNQFGAAVGGAVVPDKTFFFGSYEGSYQRGANTTISTVPIPQAIGGNFSAIPGLTIYSPFTGTSAGMGRVLFPTGIIPGRLINPAAAAIASFIPAPNEPGLANNYVTNVPFQNDYHKFDGRIDQHFSERTAAFLRYGYSNNHAIMQSPLGDVIGAGTRGRLVGQNAAIGITHSFSDRLITDFRFGYNRYDQKLGLWGDQTALGNLLGVSNFNSLEGIVIPGMGAIGAPAWIPEHPVDNTFHWNWGWGLHTTMHNLKFGVEVRRYRSDGFLDSMNNIFGPSGTVFFGPGATLLNNGVSLSPYASLYNSFAAFLLGAPSQVGVSSFLTTPTIRQTQYGLWVGDTVQLLRKVTLDLGLRYEIFSPIEPRSAGEAAFFDPTTNTFNFAGNGGIGMHNSLYQLRNLAPRIGLAFHVTDKTVVRGGYGINYFQPPYMLSGWMAPITGAVAGVQGGYAIAPFTGQFGATVISNTAAPASLQNGTSAGNLPATVIPHNLPTPYVQTFSLQLQRDFYYGTMLSLGYVGALDRHLPFVEELNAAAPGTGAFGLPFAGLGRTSSTSLYDNGLTSNYNSLQVSLSKRFSQGISFLASYTWSKALGYTANNGMLLNPFDLRSNYAPLDWDRQHVLTISHLWELPFGRHGSNIVSTILGGWQLNGVATWSTGTPLTLTADPLLCACPGNTVLASFNGSSPVTGNFGNGQSFFNNSAFFAPAGANIGNLGRNSLRGPDFWNYNLSLFKSFRVRDRFNFELRGEAYNLSNTVHPVSPVTNINSPDFGQITSSVNGAFGRQINFGGRLLF